MVVKFQGILGKIIINLWRLIHLLTYSTDINNVPGTVPGTGAIAITKQTNPSPHRMFILIKGG